MGIVSLLAYFGDDLRLPLQKVKYGEFEAHFVTASTENSLRVHTRLEVGSARTRDILARAREQVTTYIGTVAPAQDALLLRLDNTAPQISSNRAIANKAFRFFTDIANPLTKRYECFLAQFPGHDTEVQQHALRVARSWRQLSEEFAKAVAKGSKTRMQDLSKLFEEMVKETEKQIAAPGSPGPEPCKLDRKPGDAKEHAIDALASGQVIAFISHLITAGYGYEQAVEYMIKMEPALHNEQPGRLEFFRTRAAAKFYARWYPRDDEDLRTARKIVEELIAAAGRTSRSGPAIDPKVGLHYSRTRAVLINNMIYFRARDFLDGVKLNPDEIHHLDRLAAELRDWITTQPTTKPQGSKIDLARLSQRA